MKEEITTIELLPDSKLIKKGVKTIDCGDNLVQIIEILSVQTHKGHCFLECKVEFIDAWFDD